ncbi:Fanconi anemia core complex-associated protein 100 [Notolabrus celidotus]|uniref:Fanconi anemia core complex-associated protein 100 n=1 Tax=Notolabrus celidotus TaxID=1203425 RepID=UPI00148FA09C|nr:Fanconi anemia core complex-associated protein 100 [Notolabrus celidotus]
MDGRCAVENWAEFGSSVTSCTPRLIFASGTCVYLCTGRNEVNLFCTEKRKLTVVLGFPGPVSDLVVSPDSQFLFVASQSGVYCVCVHSILSRAKSSLADASACPAEIEISSEFLVVPEEGILCLLFEGSTLLTLSQRDTSWVLTLHRSLKQSKPSSFEMLGSFSLPVVSGVLQNASERKTVTRRNPVLMCVHSRETTPLSSSSASSTTKRCLPLKPVLYTLLFDIDAALAKSPVILCGLPDGRLCFLPLHPSASRLKVLHNLEQPVMFIGASSFEESSGHAQCLVAVGEQGRVVLMTLNKRGPEGGGFTAGFTEGCVPGPVMCGCVGKNFLYYSTVSDLLALDLSEGSCERKKDETSSTTVGALQNLTSLNVCRVVALAEPTSNAAGEIQLLALSARGMLQRITAPVRRQDGASSNVVSTPEGCSVRDLLSAIGDVCERASALKSAIKSKNQILMHLNQVLNISYLLTARTNRDEHLPTNEKAIRCHAMTSWSRLLQKDSLNLTCVLENPSPYVLERGWTLSITVSPLSYPPRAGGERSSTNFSFPFQNLHQGDTLEVSLPLAAAADTSFPVTVSCSLVFSLYSLLGEEAARLPGLQSSCISLPLNTLTVDWLHALQVDCPKAAHTRSTSQSDNTTDPVQAFINSRQIRCRGRWEGGGESAQKSEPEKYSAAVRVSSELLKDTLVSEISDSDLHQNVSLSLLGWLLSEQHEGVRRGQQSTVSSSVIHTRGPSGHTVKLAAKEVNLKEESTGKEESLITVEVQMESSSLAAVCGLHHAVLHRVQTLLQRAPDRAASKKSIQTLALRETLQRAENLLQQLQQSRVSGGFGVGVSGGHMTRSLLHVYRDLRENPLLII